MLGPEPVADPGRHAPGTPRTLLRRGGTYLEAGNFVDSGETTINVHRHLAAKNVLLIGNTNHPNSEYYRTIAMMRRHVIEDAESEPIRRVAAGLQAAAGLSVEPADPVADSFYWVKDRLQFQQDEDTAEPLRPLVTDPEFQAFVEMLIRPRDLVQMPDAREDCDGYATLLPTLLRAQRIPCSFVTVAADDHEPGRIVRTKEHEATPMTVDDALYEMELVGHDFFLFHDKESDRPSVVYRRHAFDYGLIRLS